MKIQAIALSVFIFVGVGCSSEKPTPTSSTPPVSETTKPQLQTNPVLVRAKSSPGAKVFIMDLKDNQLVTSPLTVKFGSEGVEIAKAGEVKDNSGHFHLLIDVDTLPAMDQPIPNNEHMLHFGQGQTEATITLSPGPHTLQLLLAGGNHVPNDPPVMSEKIHIIVEKSEETKP